MCFDPNNKKSSFSEPARCKLSEKYKHAYLLSKLGPTTKITISGCNFFRWSLRKLKVAKLVSASRELSEKYKQAYIRWQLGPTTKATVCAFKLGYCSFRGRTQLAQKMVLFILFWKLFSRWIWKWQQSSDFRKCVFQNFKVILHSKNLYKFMIYM